jgi:alpha-tubulin suppressor-like RCC1 family protein
MNGTTVPAYVAGLASSIQAVAVGDSFACALTAGGAVKCWGSNQFGQLGNSSASPSSSVPVDVTGLSSGVEAIAASGGHACALTTGGAVKCWGENGYGELGAPLVPPYSGNWSSAFPLDIASLSAGIRAISTGDHHACALAVDGAVKCWGTYQSDTFTTIRGSPVPIDVPGAPSNFQAIATGGNQACGLTDGGTVKCWGRGWSGALGNGSTDDSDTPVEVVGL